MKGRPRKVELRWSKNMGSFYRVCIYIEGARLRFCCESEFGKEKTDGMDLIVLDS